MTTTVASVPAFSFDREKHIYHLGNEVLPSVTEVLKDNGFISESWFTEKGRSRGAAVHHATYLFDQDKLIWDSLHKDLWGYIHSWYKIKVRLGIEVIEAEKSLYNGLYRYAGTLDRLVRIGRWEHVWDLKTMPPTGGAAPKWCRYQSAAYEGMLPPYGSRKRAAVELHADGSMATLKPHEDLDDLQVFLCMLTTTRARRENGL